VQTLRFASNAVAARYPLPTVGPLAWSQREGGWSTTIALPDLPNDSLVVPSCAISERPNTDFTVDLTGAGARWTLAPTAATVSGSGEPVDVRATTHIDYFHCRADLSNATAHVTVAGVEAPREYLVSIALRPFRLAPNAGTRSSVRCVVPAISQLTAPRAIRHRICSPTCVAMVLAYHRLDVSLLRAVQSCLHPPTGLFGVWPLAIRTLTDAGLIAAVECFDDFDSVAPLLDRGLPVVASIRFAHGALLGSPLNGTDGHLVVVTGLDDEWVYVNDPAARDASVVPRRYSRAALAAAWFSERGAAYVAAPL
jgi:hypothetical protein